MKATATGRSRAIETARAGTLETAGGFEDRALAACNSAARLRLLWESRKRLARAAIIGLMAGVLFAFLLPKRYVSAVKLMPPNPQSAQGAAAMMANLSARSGSAMPGIVGSLLGLDGSGALFIGILESRTVQARLVRRFDLKRVYRDRLEEDACRDLAARTAISEDRKSGIITIAVTDRRPQRAASIAQAYVEELDRLSAELSTSAARRERVFLEERLRAVKVDLDQASREFSQFASQNSTIDIKEQGRTMVEAAARLQGELIAALSEIKGLEEIYTASNVRVRSVRARILELQKQLDKLGGAATGTGPAEKVGAGIGGKEIEGAGIEAADAAAGTSEGSPATDPSATYPSIRQLPLLGVKYADLYRRTKIQEAVFETLTQQYELAKVQEAKETPAVKVLDEASVPERRSFPPRLALMFTLAAAGLVAGMAWVMVEARWQELDAIDPHKALARDVVSAIRAQMFRAQVSGIALYRSVNRLQHGMQVRFSGRRKSSNFRA